MAFVVTLTDWTPPRRVDTPAEPWIKAQIEESVDGEIPWTQIEEFTFTDPDIDPSNPKSRSFTTENASLERGWYRIVWVDGTGDTHTTDPVYNAPLPKWSPTVADIGAKLRARTKDDANNEIGTFTGDTRPTAEQVERLILDATDDVALIIGTNTSQVVLNYAKRVATIKAAMDVELSFYPEQIERGMSPYNALERQLERDLKDLYRVIDPDGEGGQAPGSDLLPQYTYPEDDGGLVGWQTRF